jgi:hypothetical protein
MSADQSFVTIDLRISDEPALFILLAADGLINRLGTGEVGGKERSLYVGKIDQPILSELLSKVTPELQQWHGKFLADPKAEGLSCELQVSVKDESGPRLATAWKYGTESLGPPPEVCTFVVAALEATEPWFEQQKRLGTDASR